MLYFNWRTASAGIAKIVYTDNTKSILNYGRPTYPRLADRTAMEAYTINKCCRLICSQLSFIRCCVKYFFPRLNRNIKIRETNASKGARGWKLK